MDANQDPTESLVDSHQADPDIGPDPYQMTGFRSITALSDSGSQLNHSDTDL